MKSSVLGAVIGAGLMATMAGAFEYPRAATSGRAAYPEATAIHAEGGMIAVGGPMVDNGQLLTVIDPKQRSMGVYRIDGPTGRIKLVAVRNIQWDLQVLQLNSDNPSPQEIRSLLEQR